MSIPSNKFTFKIIIGYLVLGALAVFVSVFLYNELKEDFNPTNENLASNKIVETGSLINSLYETDSFANLALLTLAQKDFETYLVKNDSLFTAINSLKTYVGKPFQLQQLDSIKMLLSEKKLNIEQLRLLKITNRNDSSLDDILQEFTNLETNMGVVTMENFVKNPSSLTKAKRKKLQNYIDYVNASRENNSPMIKTAIIDSMLAATRYIVSGAKRHSERLKKSLLEQEGELIENDLNISVQLRRIIHDFDSEINRNQQLENLQKQASVNRSSKVLKIAAIAGAIVIILFSFWLINDFFRAERLKNKLQKEKKTTEALLESREQLISTVSHDLKTPLSTIAGYTELFKNTGLSEKQLHYTNHISANTTYITKLADDLLDLSKLEAGKIKLEKVPFSLSNLVTQIAENNAALHTEKPVDLNLKIAPDLEAVLFTSDPIRIQQIVNNLISNAFKFTHQGSVNVVILKPDLSEKEPIITIKISDTGIGISKEKQELIFQEFTQAEADTAQKFGGSGLGLTISKKLAHLLNGTLTLNSETGVGSSFIFSFPLKVSQHQQLDQTKKSIDIKSNLKAIILDDDEAILQMLVELCSQINIDVRTFTSFSEMRKESNLSFDFILTDMQMPKYSGLDVLTQLKSGKLNGYQNQPIILMTGDNTFSKAHYVSLGFTDMLQKPFSSSLLKTVLSKHFNLTVKKDLPQSSSETHQKNSSKHFDLSLLVSFLGSEKAIREVLDVFVLQSKENVKMIQKSIQAEDYKTMADTAHKMLTMCRQIQAKNVNPILEKLERFTTEQQTTSELKETEIKLVETMQLLIDDLQKIYTSI